MICRSQLVNINAIHIPGIAIVDCDRISLFRGNDVDLARFVIYDHHIKHSVTIQVACSDVREAWRESKGKDSGVRRELPKRAIQCNLQRPSIEVGGNSIDFAILRKRRGEHSHAVSRGSLGHAAVNEFKAVWRQVESSITVAK
jgi:hypothetical protein